MNKRKTFYLFKNLIVFLSKLLFIYAFSGGLYLMIELLFRGYTFLEMYYLAGFLGLIAYFSNNILTYDFDFLLQCILLTIIGTFFEGVVGNLVNTDYHMWDYTTLPFSFWNDQCNLIFMFFWFLLFIITVPLLDYIGWKCWNEEKPYYRIFGKLITPYH